MALPYVGNAIPAPSYVEGGFTTNDELLFSANDYHQRGVTLKPGQGVLLLGTLLKQDPTSKMYVKATDNTATGILRQTVDTGLDAAGQVWQANILYAGTLKLSKVSAANSGVTLTSVLNARVNTVAGFFKF